MATYFVISDIHSFYDEMIISLNEAGYDKNNRNHVLISCGDLFDRGPNSLKCLEFINSIPNENKVLIRGNHEDLIEDIFERGYFRGYDYHNKTNETIKQISNQENYDLAIDFCRNYAPLREYLDSCINYFETEDYIFTHSWIPYKKNKNNVTYYDEDWRNASKESFYESRWGNPFDFWNAGLNKTGKTIVCGHWHTSYAHSKYHHYGNEWEDNWIRIWNQFYSNTPIKDTACFNIFKDNGIIGLDACTAYSGKVNVLKLGKQKKLNYYFKED